MKHYIFKMNNGSKVMIPCGKVCVAMANGALSIYPIDSNEGWNDITDLRIVDMADALAWVRGTKQCQPEA